MPFLPLVVTVMKGLLLGSAFVYTSKQFLNALSSDGSDETPPSPPPPASGERAGAPGVDDATNSGPSPAPRSTPAQRDADRRRNENSNATRDLDAERQRGHRLRAPAQFVDAEFSAQAPAREESLDEEHDGAHFECACRRAAREEAEWLHQDQGAMEGRRTWFDGGWNALQVERLEEENAWYAEESASLGVPQPDDHLSAARRKGESDAQKAIENAQIDGEQSKATRRQTRSGVFRDATNAGNSAEPPISLSMTSRHHENPYFTKLLQDAKTARNKMNNFLKRAKTARQQGKIDLAEKHQVAASNAGIKRGKLIAQASAWIFTLNNHDRPDHIVDLHGLSVAEARYYVNVALQTARRRSHSRVVFIVGPGQGIHSTDGNPKIKPAIIEMLQSRDITVILNEHNSGRITAQLQELQDDDYPW